VNSLPDATTLAQLVTSVTETMCGITFVPAESNNPSPHCYRMALLPITGQRRLEVALYSDQASCEALSSSLFSLAKEDIDTSMIEDSLRELLNMAAGQIKQAVAPDHTLGLPKVIGEQDLGENHRRARDTGVLLKTVGPVQLFIWITEAERALQDAA
jgi:hypothetical protein